MLRSQRIVLMVGLIVIALLLHINACEWRWRAQGWEPQAIVVLWTHDPLPTAALRGGVPASGYTGLFPDRGANTLVALVVGVVAPLALVVAALVLLLGWRQHERFRRGLCQSCGYDLRGQTNISQAGSNERCPECGHQRAEQP